MTDTAPLTKLAQKLAGRATLDDSDREAILALPYVRRAYAAGSYIMREGDPGSRWCGFISGGYAFRQKITMQGRRQIISLHLPGDILDSPHLFLRHADYSAQALTDVETIEINSANIRALLLTRPAIAEAMWIDTMIEASILREWLTNVGRRDARARVTHLLCEFALRMTEAGVGSIKGYDLPMTQEQIGDATGLTSVHINRTLRFLVGDGFITRDGHNIGIPNWENLRAVGEFSALYLHLDKPPER